MPEDPAVVRRYADSMIRRYRACGKIDLASEEVIETGELLEPASLADWVLDELDEARQQYVSSEFETEDRQPTLPFIFGRIASA